MAYKIEKEGKPTWYSFSIPIVENWEVVSQCSDEEYEERTKNYVKDKIHYVTIEIPLEVLATNEELQKKAGLPQARIFAYGEYNETVNNLPLAYWYYWYPRLLAERGIPALQEYRHQIPSWSRSFIW